MFRGTRDKPINHGLDLEAKHPAQVSLCPGNRAVGGTCRALNGFSSRLYCSIGNFFLCQPSPPVGGLVTKLFLTLTAPQTRVHQAPLFMGFPRQEYWNGLPLPSPRDLPDPGIKHGSPELQADSLPIEPPGKDIIYQVNLNKNKDDILFSNKYWMKFHIFLIFLTKRNQNGITNSNLIPAAMQDSIVSCQIGRMKGKKRE